MRICRYFHNDFKSAFNAKAEQLQQAGLENSIIEEWLKLKSSLDLEKEKEKLDLQNIQIIDFKSENYPKLLLEIPDLPPLLYVRGKMENTEELCVAVVGSRKITTYGRTVTPDLVLPLCRQGATIVSGLAFGVDALAHETAVKAGKRTMAVLGGGVDEQSVYPKHHQLLAQQIIETGGALLSEYPPKTPNLQHHFISRNRIISGMSSATLVVECGLDSGSLITARHALEQNRQVFAVPGPIYSPMSEGPNNLLKMGAKPVTKASDILEDLNIQALPENEEAQNLFDLSVEEKSILAVLSKEPKLLDQLIKDSGLNARLATSALTFLEMKGKVRNMGGQQYILSR